MVTSLTQLRHFIRVFSRRWCTMSNNDFATHLSAYFLKYMPTRTGYSSNTIKSYRDTFVILFRYCQSVLRIKPEKIDFKVINRHMAEDFLSWLECQRYSISTRNLRLAALQSFFRYVQLESPEYMELCSSILAIKSKKNRLLK
jgi:site-specific recombinase XerD